MLAHQGGWDEILMVLTPIALFAAILFFANRRARADLARERAADQEGEPASRPERPAAERGQSGS
ncbi:hypothetical protein BH24ACT3_BH24ACT3_14830 [soil metagenome]